MPTILMVDDDPILLDLYYEVLSEGFNILTACSVATAIEVLATGQVDAVGCDYHLNDGSGMDIVEWIAAHQPELLNKTALISGELKPPTHGFNIQCLYKPVEMETLLETFDAWTTTTTNEQDGDTHAA